MPDLTKLTLHTGYPAFKNNTIYTGTLTMSGSTSAGLNVKTFTVNLTSVPDMLDVQFNGPGSTLDSRPNGAWFKSGYIAVPTNNAGSGNPSVWQPYTSITGSVMTIKMVYVQQFTTSETLTSTNFFYRIIDYSVF